MAISTTMKSDRRFTIEELRTAGTSEKAWVAIRGKVYDVTDFARRHPGGEDFLMAAAGRDATAVFESFHEPKAIKILAKREIGKLVESDMPQYPPQTEFQAAVRKNVGAYFKEIGKDPRDAMGMLLPYSIGIGAYVLSYAIMFSPSIVQHFAILPWLAALAHGWSSALLGLYLLHDSCHSSFTRSPFVWDIMRRSYEMMTGLSSVVWIHQHVLGHHPFTNVVEIDPDIIQTDPGVIRIHESQPWWSYYALQSYYWIPLYAQLVFSRRLTEWKQLFVDRKFKSITINALPPREYFWGFAALVSYLTIHLMIPHFVLNISLLRIIATYVISDSFWSLYLMLVFQSSHVNDEVTWSLASQNNSLRDWAILQIESSMDFAHGNWWTTFLTGSLNYQAVHHLFPHISQYYYPAIAPIVQETCKQFGVKYNIRGSLSEVLVLHVNRLTNMGTSPDEKLDDGMVISEKSALLESAILSGKIDEKN